MRDPDPCSPDRAEASNKVRQLSWAKYQGAWWWKDLKLVGDGWHPQAEFCQSDWIRAQAEPATLGTEKALGADAVTAACGCEYGAPDGEDLPLTPLLPGVGPDHGEVSAEDVDEYVIGISPADREADPLFGLTFGRIVEGRWFRCRVVDIVAGAFSNVRLYLIRYSDGEVEHLVAEEVLACLRAKPPDKAGSQKKRRAATPVARHAPGAEAANGSAGVPEGRQALAMAEGGDVASDGPGDVVPEVGCTATSAQQSSPRPEPLPPAIPHVASTPQYCVGDSAFQVPAAGEAAREDGATERLVAVGHVVSGSCGQCASLPGAVAGDPARAPTKDDVGAIGRSEVYKYEAGKLRLDPHEGVPFCWGRVFRRFEPDEGANGKAGRLRVEVGHARGLSEILVLLLMCLAFSTRVGVVSFEARALSSSSRVLQDSFDRAQSGGDTASIGRLARVEFARAAGGSQRCRGSKSSDPCIVLKGLEVPKGAACSPDKALRLEEGQRMLAEQRYYKGPVQTRSAADGSSIETSTGWQPEGGTVHDAVGLGQLFCRHRKGQDAPGMRRDVNAVGSSCPTVPPTDGQPPEAEACGAEAPGVDSGSTGARLVAGSSPLSGEAGGDVMPPASPLDLPPAVSGDSDWSWTPITPFPGGNDSDTVDYADDPLALDRMPPGDISSSADTWLLAQAIPSQSCPAQSVLPSASFGADDHEGGHGCGDSDPACPRRSRAPTPRTEGASPVSAPNRSAGSTSSRTDGSITVLSSLSAAAGVRRRHVPASSTDSDGTISTDSGVHVGSRRRRRALPHDEFHLHQEFLTATAALAADVAAQIAAETEAEAGSAAAGSDRHQEFIAATAALAADVAAQVAAEDFHPEFLTATAALVVELAAEEEAAAAREAAETERLICVMLDRDGTPGHATAEAAVASAAVVGDAAGIVAGDAAADSMGDPGPPQAVTETGSSVTEAAVRPEMGPLGHGNVGDVAGLVQISRAVSDVVCFAARPDLWASVGFNTRRVFPSPDRLALNVETVAGSAAVSATRHQELLSATTALAPDDTTHALAEVSLPVPTVVVAGAKHVPDSGVLPSNSAMPAYGLTSDDAVALVQRKSKWGRRWRSDRGDNEAKSRRRADGEPSGAPASTSANAWSSNGAGETYDGNETADPLGVFASSPAEATACDRGSTSVTTESAASGSADGGVGPGMAHTGDGAGKADADVSRRTPYSRPAAGSSGESGPTRLPPWRVAKAGHGGSAGSSGAAVVPNDVNEVIDPLGIFADSPVEGAADDGSSLSVAGGAVARGTAGEGGGPGSARAGVAAGKTAADASRRAFPGRPATGSGGMCAPERLPPWRAAKAYNGTRSGVITGRSGQTGCDASHVRSASGRCRADSASAKALPAGGDGSSPAQASSASATATAGRVCLVARASVGSSAASTAGRAVLVSRGGSEVPAFVEGQGAGGAGGNPPVEDTLPALGGNADRHAEAATAARRKRRAPPRPVDAGSVRAGGEVPTAMAASVATAPQGPSSASSPVAGAEMPVCDYLYPPVCRHCRGVLGHYANLPRLVCGACDSVGPIAPLPEDYLGCTRCRFFVCAHCIADLATGRTLGLCSGDESSGHTMVVATGVSLAAAEGAVAYSTGATAAADIGAPEMAYDTAVPGDSTTEADRRGSAASSSDSTEDSDGCDSYARWHDAAGLVQMTCTVPARQRGASEVVAPSGNAARLNTEGFWHSTIIGGGSGRAGSTLQSGAAPRSANKEPTWKALRQTALDRAFALIGNRSDIATSKQRKALVRAALCQAVALVGLPQGRCPADIINDEAKQRRILQASPPRDRPKRGAASLPSFGGAGSGVLTGIMPKGSCQIASVARGVPDVPGSHDANPVYMCQTCMRVVCGTVFLVPAGSEPCRSGLGLPEKSPGGGQVPGSSNDGGVIAVDTPPPTPRRGSTPGGSEEDEEESSASDV